jgi:cobalt/nickel transport system permease protein
LPVLGTGGLVALSLWLSSSDYTPVATVMIATYLPLAIGEAFVTMAVVAFLTRLQPEALRPVRP